MLEKKNRDREEVKKRDLGKMAGKKKKVSPAFRRDGRRKTREKDDRKCVGEDRGKNTMREKSQDIHRGRDNLVRNR